LILLLINNISGEIFFEQKYNFTLVENININTIKKWNNPDDIYHCNDKLNCGKVKEVCEDSPCFFPEYICREDSIDGSTCYAFINESDVYNFNITSIIHTSCSKNKDCITNLCIDNQCQINNNFSYYYCIPRDLEFSYECNSINIDADQNYTNDNNSINLKPIENVNENDNSEEKDYTLHILIGLYITTLLTIFFICTCCCCKNTSKDGDEELIKKNENKPFNSISTICATCTGIILAIAATFLFFLLLFAYGMSHSD